MTMMIAELLIMTIFDDHDVGELSDNITNNEEVITLCDHLN